MANRKNSPLRTMAMLIAAVTLAVCTASADTLSLTFVGVPTGVNDGVDYVLPYQASVNGALTQVICYDIFDNVSFGQSWTVNELTVAQAAADGQFSAVTDSLTRYEEVGFLSQQSTGSPQDQVDLQHAIWNVFAPGAYSVSPGMQAYLNRLTSPAYSNFDFNTVRLLEDVNQGSGRAQAFVIEVPDGSPSGQAAGSDAVPEPGTVTLVAAGAVLVLFGSWTIRRKQPE